MSEILDDIAFLSQEIGPRPAGTEEEHQAAQYLADRFGEAAGIDADIEEFTTTNRLGLATPLLFAISILASLIGLIVPAIALVSFIITLICMILVALEILDKPLISNLLNRGVSQNVIARYVPGQEGKARSRKIIVVANYDSDRVAPELNTLTRILPILQKISYGAMVALPFCWIIYMITSGNIVGTILIAIALIGALIVPVQWVLHRVNDYNQAANNNASGAAALVQIAKHAQDGGWEDLPEFNEGDPAEIYGYDAAEHAGVIPVDIPIDYEVEPNMAVTDPIDTEDLEAMRSETTSVFTGEIPLAPTEGDDLDVPEEGSLQETLENDEGTDLPVSSEEVVEEVEKHEVPSWFTSAQKKANKPKNTGKVKRSRYADALDAAVAESSKHFTEANEVVEAETEQCIKARVGCIEEVAVPKDIDDIPAKAEPTTPLDVPAEEPEASDDEEHPVDPSATTAMPPIDVTTIDIPEPGPSMDRFIVTSRDPKEVTVDTTVPETAPEPPVGRTTNRVVVDTIDPVEVPQTAPEGSDWIHEQETSVLPRLELPELEVDFADLQAVDQIKQRAPLAEAAEAAPGASKPSLSSMIPRIELNDPTDPNAIPDNKRAALGQMLPTVTETVPDPEPQQQQNQTVSLTGSFAAVGTDRTFAPVGDELVADVAPEEIYIDDADDSIYDEAATTTGAFAGPGYMEMPSEHRGLRGLFHRKNKKKNKEETQNATEWLGVDADFNPTEVGAQRGGWESFQNESSNFNYNDFDDIDFDDPSATQKWNGGAFSLGRIGKNKGSAPDQAPVEERRPRRNVEAIPPEFAAVADLAAAKISEEGIDDQIVNETKEIYDFRNSNVSIEVWFVALGAECNNHDGMKAFIREHGKELRGSVILNLESLGSGELSVVDQEGLLFPRTSSSRIKRYIRTAAKATGITPAKMALPWRDSPSSVAMHNGLQAVTLAGIDGAKPSMMGQKDDVIENIDEEILEQNIAFVDNILKNV